MSADLNFLTIAVFSVVFLLLLLGLLYKYIPFHRIFKRSENDNWKLDVENPFRKSREKQLENNRKSLTKQSVVETNDVHMQGTKSNISTLRDSNAGFQSTTSDSQADSASQTSHSPQSRIHAQSQMHHKSSHRSSNPSINLATSEEDRKIGITSASLRITKHDDYDRGRNSLSSSRHSFADTSADNDLNEDGALSKLSKKIRSNSSLHRAASKEKVNGEDGSLQRVSSFSKLAGSSSNTLRRTLSHSKQYLHENDSSTNPEMNNPVSRSRAGSSSSRETGFSPSSLALALEYVSAEQAATGLINLKPIQAAQTLMLMNQTRANSVFYAIENIEIRMKIKTLWDQLASSDQTQN